MSRGLGDALHDYPRLFMCWWIGVHGKVCVGRRDEAHEMWRLELRYGLRRLPWWDRVSPVDELRWRWRWLRDAVPLPERVDLALSRRTWRRNYDQIRYAGVDRARVLLEEEGCCRVCVARWCYGRSIRRSDEECARAIARAAERAVA